MSEQHHHIQPNDDGRRTTPDTRSVVRRLSSVVIFLLGLLIFIPTLAPGVVFGDPTEYTLMPHLWAILHPPGYAFMTLLVKLWQTIIPVGTLAYRTNLLSAFAAAGAGVMVFGAVRNIAPTPGPPAPFRGSPVAPHPERSEAQSKGRDGGGEIAPALLAALSLLTASDFWQHAIHTNAHIVTAMLAAASIFLLFRWRATKNDRWLYAFGVVAGLSVTHHPLLVLGFPAYAVFVLANLKKHRRVGELSADNSNGKTDARQSSVFPFPIRWKKVSAHIRPLLVTAIFALLGLSPWLYFPIRSAIQPPPSFGPHDMNTVNGFLNLALARGLTNVNLFHFGLGEQWHRLIVFRSLIQLQFAASIIALAVIGLIWLGRRDPRAALLLGLHAAINLAFTMNSVQDVMAYFLVPLVSISICVGAGVMALREFLDFLQTPKVYKTFGLLALLVFPLANILWLAPRISLRNLRAADNYVDSVFAHFAGKGEHAVLLSDWEHATPLWYRGYVDGQTLDPADVTVVYVNKLFVDAVWGNIDKGPIYLIEYNRDIVNTGFRLRAEGNFYRLIPPPATERPQIAHPLNLSLGSVEFLGYDALTDTARAGDVIPIILYLRAPAVTDHIIHPFAILGGWEQRFTTDSHLLTPYWSAGEIIAERWEVTVPLDAPTGVYPLRVGFSDLTSGADLGAPIFLETVEVAGNGGTQGNRIAERLAANFGQRVGVESVRAWGNGEDQVTRSAPWTDPISARAGESIEIRIKWRALASPENSYTVFVHLLDSGNGLIASQDYTPLGGAFPTMLWFPKWLEGQTVIDPYTIAVPPETPPGDYYFEIGLYGLRSVVRVPAFDAEGNLAGDRFVLGGVTVKP